MKKCPHCGFETDDDEVIQCSKCLNDFENKDKLRLTPKEENEDPPEKKSKYGCFKICIGIFVCFVIIIIFLTIIEPTEHEIFSKVGSYVAPKFSPLQRVFCSSFILLMGVPITHSSPRVGLSIPAIIFTSVVFPAPDLPIMATNSPGNTWRFIPFSAGKYPAGVIYSL